MRFMMIFCMILIIAEVRAQDMPYTNQTEAGLLLGTGIVPAFTVQMFNGVRINKWNIEAGLNAGIDIYPQITILPVSAGIKWNPFNSNAVSPYIGINAGYGFDWLQHRVQYQDYGGGYMINSTFGMRVKTKKAVRLNLSAGFKRQKAVIYPLSNPNDFIGQGQIAAKDEYFFNRVSLGFGLSF